MQKSNNYIGIFAIKKMVQGLLKHNSMFYFITKSFLKTEIKEMLNINISMKEIFGKINLKIQLESFKNNLQSGKTTALVSYYKI